MNDEMLAQQLAATGNLMDLLSDEAWLRETDAIEAECGGRVEAGLYLKPYVEQLEAVSPEVLRQQRRQVQMLSVLLPELKAWLQSWELGRSFEAVYIEAQRRLYEHLQHPTPEQAKWMASLLAKTAQPAVPDQGMVPGSAIALMSQMFTDDDWQALAQTAAEATAAGIWQVRQQEVTAAATS